MAEKTGVDETALAAARCAIPLHVANDVADPLAHATDRLHRAFAWLRAHAPLGYARPDGFEGFWVVTRQADIKAFARRPKLFRNGEQSVSMMSLKEQAAIRAFTGGDALPYRHMLVMDAPDHPKYRLLTSDQFAPRNLTGMVAKIRQIARGYIDKMAALGGECDFATEISHRYPLSVVMSLLGVPPEDDPLMLRITHDLTGAGTVVSESGHVTRHSSTAGSAVVEAAAEFDAYFERLMAKRRDDPRDDLVSQIANARIDGQPIPAMEATSYCLVLATAGHDTTAMTTAGAVELMARNPDETRKLRADLSLIPAMIEEANRIVAPSKITMRTVENDVEFQGRALRAGERVGLAWASANRDESIYDDPDRFRIDRPPSTLFSFGTGVHACLGQHLARLEMRIFFEEFFARIDDVELAGETAAAASHMMSGPKVVPIRYRTQ